MDITAHYALHVIIAQKEYFVLHGWNKMFGF